MKGLFEEERKCSEPNIHKRLGFDLTVPKGLFKGDRPRGIYAKVQQKFVERLDLLHSALQGNPQRHTRASVMRNQCTCHLCGRPMTKGFEWEFQYNNFIWPESYLHLIDRHGLRPPKSFYKEVVRATIVMMPLSRIEALITEIDSE